MHLPRKEREVRKKAQSIPAGALQTGGMGGQGASPLKWRHEAPEAALSRDQLRTGERGGDRRLGAAAGLLGKLIV